MREVIYYVADDGKKFEDEYECRDYERNYEFAKMADSIILLDKNYNPQKIIDFDDCQYVIIRDKSAINPFIRMCREIGFYSPWDGNPDLTEDCGVYVYNDKEDSWYNLEKTINKHVKMLKEVRFALGNEFGFETLYK